ncbi:MAG: RNA polymerase sigma factor [Bryobacterales bacterium]|jgi:RNA polymerase sigma factor (sigma-70 family)|nr:RNA polymerase sigma factor [Bryobacterales bacterium]
MKNLTTNNKYQTETVTSNAARHHTGNHHCEDLRFHAKSHREPLAITELAAGAVEENAASGERCLSEAEFATAFQTHFRKTVRFLRSRGASDDLAEEVAQEAWARGWERLHQLRNPEVVDVWVNSIAKHLWRNRVVRDQRNKELNDNMAVDHRPDGKILWEQITQACGEEEQKILNLHYVRGYTSNEIAERVGSTALAIRLRLMRTRRKLEQMFDRDLLFAGA